MNLFRPFRPYFLNLNRITTPLTSFADFVRQAAGNTGNGYIGETLVKHLAPKAKIRGVNNIFTDALDDAALEEAKNSTHIILALQDQVRQRISYFENPPWEALGAFIEKAKKPVVVFSLGANAFPDAPWAPSAIDPALVNTLRIVSDHSISMGVRCHFSAEALASLGLHKVSVIGCPSYFFMGKNRTVKKKAALDESDKIIFNGFFPVPAVKNPDYTVQDESFFLRLMIEPGTLMESDFATMKAGHAPYAQQIVTAALEGRVHAHPDFRRAILHYRSAAFSIGTRLHGSIASLNAGTPTVLTSGDERARGTALLFGIPHHPGLRGDGINLRGLYEGISITPMNDAYLSAYNNYKAFFEINGLPYFGDTASTESDLKRPGLPSLSTNDKSKGRLLDFMIESAA